MWDITLQVLSVVGNILLILLALFLLLTLLFLFFPVVYRLEGKKTPEEVRLSAEAGWLFGLLRLKFAYPEPGKLTVKILWKTVFDSSQRKEKGETVKRAKKKKGRKASENGETEKPREDGKPGGDEKPLISAETAGSGESTKPPAIAEAAGTGGNTEPPAIAETAGSGESTEPPAIAEAANSGENIEPSSSAETANSGENPESPGEETAGDEGDGRESRTDGKAGIFEKAGKIKYTIQKICDKIKEVWENLSYYTQLLQEENTAGLWRHVRLRLGKILRSIRPRHIRADLLFGAASPDTTGYVYGFYCMFSPVLGEAVTVTPDFTQAVFQGEAEVSGCVTGAVLVWNALKLLLDRKLHLFVKKMKAGRKRDGR